jgi:hypothetical protein
MKGKHSNNKLVFVYQDKTERAAASNPSLNAAESGSCVIRVVQNCIDPANNIQTHHDYVSSGATQLAQIGIDSLVSASVSGIIRTSQTGASSFESTSDIVQSISHFQIGGAKVIDIVISQTLQSIINTQSNLYKAVVELNFISGDVEDVVLNLKPADGCALIISPDQLTIHGPISVTAGNEDPDLPPGMTGSRVAYSFSKIYRRLNERSNASTSTNNTTRKQYGIGYKGHATFTMPWGGIFDDLSSKTLFGTFPAGNQSWLSESGYATAKTTYVNWFTGINDVTNVRFPNPDIFQIGNGQGQSPPALALSTQGVNFSNFFGSKIIVDRTTSDSSTLAFLVKPEGKLSFGKQFGWFSTFVSGDIVSPTGQVMVSENSENYGVPPIFRESFQAPNNGTGVDRPGHFWCAFSDTIPAADGTAIANDFGLTSLSTTFGPNPQNQSTDPTESRYSKLFYGGSNTDWHLPGHTNVSTGSVVNTNFSTAYINSYLADYAPETIRPYYALIVVEDTKLSGTALNSKIRLGSLDQITSNYGASFFYPGSAGTSSDPYVPVFKGIARICTVTRYTLTSDTTLGLSLSNSLRLGGLDDNSLADVHGIYASLVPHTNLNINESPTQGLGPDDELFYSLLFAGHTYPRQLTGSLQDTMCGHMPQVNAAAFQTWRLGLDCLRTDGANILVGQGEIQVSAQDIVVLNSGIVPDPYNGFSPSDQDSTDSRGRAISRNHPVGWAGNKDQQVITPSYEHFINSQFGVRPYPITSRSYHTDLGEDATSPVPPYPYAPTMFLTQTLGKPGYANFVGPESGTTGYFHPQVSDSNDGETFLTSAGQQGIVIPTSANTGFNESFFTGTDQCFTGQASTVTLTGVSGSLSSAIGTGELKIRYEFFYTNNCSGEFETDAGSKIVLENSDTLANRITKVRQIFPHIEYRPLAMDNALNESPLAYKLIVEDNNDVDNIFIDSIGSNSYRLVVEITADSDDVAFLEGADVNFPYGDIWPDTPYPSAPSTDSEELPDFSKRYISVEGNVDYSRFKGSFITIASASNWNTFPGNTSIIQSTNADLTRFAYHTPFITYGNLVDPPDGVFDIPGCTDENAINYDSTATVDNGTCLECNSVAEAQGWDIANIGLNNGTTGMRLGVYEGPSAVNSYLCGLTGDAQTSLETYFNVQGQAYGQLYNSTGAQYGGAVVCNNDFADNTGVANLSIRGVNQGSTAFTNLLNWMATTYNETYTAWKLHIRPLTDQLANIIDLEQSYSESNPPPTQLIPGAFNYVTPDYTATATGGTITEPTWDEIVTIAATQNWFRAGRVYLIELELDPQELPAECTLLNSNYNRVLGLMWTTFCSCADITNDYFSLAMSGFQYPWQQNIAYPILPYQPASNCPDIVPSNNLLGDGAYPNSICFTQDEATTNCDQYWLWCIAQTTTVCDNGNLDNTIDIGTTTYFNYVSGSITVSIEGVYDPASNGFIFSPDIEYTVVVTGPQGYLQTQTQSDNVTPNIPQFTNEFLGTIYPGTYTVTVTFTSPYVSYFSGDAPCEFVDTVYIPSPDEQGCDTLVGGCTDPTADTFDPNATFDDGSCENTDPCQETLNNAAFTTTITSVNSTSNCVTNTTVVEGVSFEGQVITPNNNGQVTVNISYNSAGTEGVNINTFAVLLVAQNSSVPGVTNILDSIATMFTNLPTSEELGTSIAGVGYWSPLNNTATGSSFTEVFTGIPPGFYYVIVAANPTPESLTNCGGLAFSQLSTYLDTVTVGLDAPLDECLEPCVGPNCEEYTLGCTDPEADNYNPDATYDDGTCEVILTHCEQNPTDEECYDCTDLLEGAGARFALGSLSEPPCDDFEGGDGECTDPNACNYNPDAPLDASNNLVCEYCGCVGSIDPDCDGSDTECDPATDPNCQEQEPECPDPSNPNCDPTVYDPCPVGDCGPPVDPCIILGNCTEDGGGGDDEDDPFVDVVNPVEITCAVDIESADGSPLNFSAVQQQAFQCMSEEGKKLLFRMKSGAYYDDTDILKLSLIAYLFAGGLNNSELPCLFNCNYESADKSKAFDCSIQWVASGAKYYNSTDTYSKGETIMYFHQKGGKVTRSYYTATREMTPLDIHPRFPNSGWARCQDVKLRTADRNNIATGNEEYLQVFWEFMTRFCNECQVSTMPPSAENVNNVDPKVLKNYIDPKTNNNTSSGSGILGEDGEELIF